MRNEDLKLILNVLADNEAFADEETDWYGILGFLELNKISGYFYNKTREHNVALPKNIERKLSQILRIQSVRNEVMRKYIEDVGDELRFEKLRYAFLKGSVLSNANFNFSELSFSCMALSDGERKNYEAQRANTFYAAGERISNDIDILIEQKDITRVSRILKDLGFIQGYYDFKNQEIVELSRQEILSRRMNRGETAPFILKTDNEIVPFIEVDINFSLDYLPVSSGAMLDKILSDTVDYSGLIKGGIKSLSADDFFLHLIMHQYKESILYSMVQRSKDAELYKLLDVYLFIKRGVVDLNGLYYRIKKFGIEKECYYVLSEMKEIFLDFQPDGFLKSIEPEDLSYLNEVIEPQTKRSYIWQIPFDRRLNFYSKTRFLKEKTDD